MTRRKSDDMAFSVESDEMAYTFADDLAEAGIGKEAAGKRSDMTVPFEQGETARSSLYRNGGKRVFDLIVVFLLLPIVIPVLVVVMVITALDGGRPIYSQERIGRFGRVFRCWKVRTMVPDAENVLRRLLADDAERANEWAANQKLRDDPRVTRWGHILRKSSLDELPQLWNVIVGDMSLIGPRPFTPDQKDLYECGETRAAYYDLRPGISGLWQVRCRNNGGFSERSDYDERYYRNLSFAEDLRIALQTVSVVLRGTGK